MGPVGPPPGPAAPGGGPCWPGGPTGPPGPMDILMLFGTLGIRGGGPAPLG